MHCLELLRFFARQLLTPSKGLVVLLMCMLWTTLVGLNREWSDALTGAPLPEAAPAEAAERPSQGGAGRGLADWPVVFAEKASGKVYRIPALLWLPPRRPGRRGRLLAFAELRASIEDHGDISLVLRSSDDEGATWSRERQLFSATDFGFRATEVLTRGNPTVLLDERLRKVILLFVLQFGCDSEERIHARNSRGSRWVFVSESLDDGVTWSKPRNVSDSVKDPSWTWYATGPGSGIQIKHGPHAGRLVAPCNHAKVTEEGGVVMRSHLIYSDNGGRTWQIGALSGPFTSECAVAEVQDGGLLVNSRDWSGSNQRVMRESFDGGASWATLQRYQQELIEPQKHGCQASMVSYLEPAESSSAGGRGQARRLLFFANPASWRRRDLTLRRSATQGLSWNESVLLYRGPAGYSALAVMLPHAEAAAAGTARVACLFENGKARFSERISFAITDASLVGPLKRPSPPTHSPQKAIPPRTGRRRRHRPH